MIAYYVIPGLKQRPQFKSLAKKQDRGLSKDSIIEKMEDRYKIPMDVLADKSRNSEIVYVRHLAMVMLYRYTQMSCSTVARMFKRDHTTVLAAMKSISNQCETNPTIHNDVKELEYLLIG